MVGIVFIGFRPIFRGEHLSFRGKKTWMSGWKWMDQWWTDQWAIYNPNISDVLHLFQWNNPLKIGSMLRIMCFFITPIYTQIYKVGETTKSIDPTRWGNPQVKLKFSHNLTLDISSIIDPFTNHLIPSMALPFRSRIIQSKLFLIGQAAAGKTPKACLNRWMKPWQQKPKKLWYPGSLHVKKKLFGWLVVICIKL